jgi:hypothetical protein
MAIAILFIPGAKTRTERSLDFVPVADAVNALVLRLERHCAVDVQD